MIIYDTLVRAGIAATSAFVSPSPLPASPLPHSSTPGAPPLATCSRGIAIRPDQLLQPSGFGPDTFDALIVPGGAKGAETISGSELVQGLVREYYEQGRVVGMICAGA